MDALYSVLDRDLFTRPLGVISV